MRGRVLLITKLQMVISFAMRQDHRLQIANSFFEIGLKFYSDVGQFLADPIST
jgi:hypothetical protein